MVPRAISAGQRIVEGMRLVACLLFTRTIYALLLVLGASLADLDFPVTPRTNSFQALLTVGIPSLVLAGWAPAMPARTPSNWARFSRVRASSAFWEFTVVKAFDSVAISAKVRSTRHRSLVPRLTGLCTKPLDWVKTSN